MGRDDQGKTRSHGQLQLPAQATRRRKLRIQRHQGNGDAGKIAWLVRRAQFASSQLRRRATQRCAFYITAFPHCRIPPLTRKPAIEIAGLCLPLKPQKESFCSAISFGCAEYIQHMWCFPIKKYDCLELVQDWIGW